MIPETLPTATAGIALGLLNGVVTLGFSLLTSLYGGFVDWVGGYGISNGILVSAGVLAIIVVGLFIDETYGGL